MNKAITLAVPAAVGLVYTICTALAAVFPRHFLQLMARVKHFSVESVKNLEPYYKVTFGSYLIGLITLIVFSFLLTWLISYFYSHLIKKEEYIFKR